MTFEHFFGWSERLCRNAAARDHRCRRGLFAVGFKNPAVTWRSGYKFDEYLITLLKAANLQAVQQAAEAADDDYGVIRRVGRSVLDDEDDFHDHDFYPAFKEYIDKNADRFKDRRTLMCAAYAAVSPPLMASLAEKHFEVLKAEYADLMDVVELRHLYRELTYAAGEQDVDRLNEMIKRRFFITMAGDAYLQALTEQYLMELLYCDKETSKLVIQFLLAENGCDAAQQ